MVLNKSKGNMYGFVSHTWNPIKGRCSHDCSYCYMKRWGSQRPLRLAENELRDDLGEGNFIFVGSSTDMFADDVPEEWIGKVIAQCLFYNKNTYLLQTKNPKRFHKYNFPENFILCITLETNRHYKNVSKAPKIINRINDFVYFKFKNKVITIEPIMNFDFAEFLFLIKCCSPLWVAIGADSGGHNLPEPSWDKVQILIEELEKFTEVKIKDNLKRLIDPLK